MSRSPSRCEHRDGMVAMLVLVFMIVTMGKSMIVIVAVSVTVFMFMFVAMAVTMIVTLLQKGLNRRIPGLTKWIILFGFTKGLPALRP